MREVGFYWIDISGDKGHPFISYWDGESWYFVGTEDVLKDDDGITVLSKVLVYGDV